jgi:hypothetical protein
MVRQWRFYDFENSRTEFGPGPARGGLGPVKGVHLAVAPLRLDITRGDNGNEQQRAGYSFTDGPDQSIVTLQIMAVAPNARFVTERLSHQNQESLVKQIYPALVLPERIDVIQVAVTDEDVMSERH